jgi:hypothetical protein
MSKEKVFGSNVGTKIVPRRIAPKRSAMSIGWFFTLSMVSLLLFQYFVGR